MTLDAYTVSTGKTSTTYTRMRAPYVNKDGFRFSIYRSGIFSGIGSFLGMQDVEVGFPKFDKKYVIKGNDEKKLKALFSNKHIIEIYKTILILYAKNLCNININLDKDVN